MSADRLAPVPPVPADPFAAAAEVARALDPDRAAAVAFAPGDRRGPLLALLAFSAEVARVREQVSDPLPGLVRHQWWRDLLAGEARGDASAHPVAAALLAAVEADRLPRAALIALVEARAFDLYDDPMPTVADLEGYLGETASALVRLQCLVLARGAEPGEAARAGHAGVAYGLAGLLRAYPWHAARGQLYLPLDLLAARGLDRGGALARPAAPGLLAALADARALARRHLAAARAGPPVPPALRPAFLPLALVEPALRAMERPGYDPFTTVVDTLPLARFLRLWRASRRERP